MLEHVSEPRVECWVRDSAPSPVLSTWLEDLTDRLRELAESGAVESVDVNVWGQRVRCPADTGTEQGPIGRDVWSNYRDFEAWASANGYSLSPAFSRRQQCTIVGESECEVVELPIVCLAVYDRADLEAVFPHSTPRRTWSVEDCLERLERAQADTTPREAGGGQIHG